jgi:hypothetical protein
MDDEDEYAELEELLSVQDHEALKTMYALQIAEANAGVVLLENIDVIQAHQEDQEKLKRAEHAASLIVSLKQKLMAERAPTDVAH